MKNIWGKTILLAFVAVFAVCADASLYNDLAAIAGYAGRTSINIIQSDIELKVDVEYVVYAPRTYLGSDLTSGNEYIYAYQIFNDLKADVAIDFFSVGIIGPATVNNIYTDDTYGYSPSFAVEPSMSNIFAQSAGYVFAGQNLNPRRWPSVLIFSSDNGPTIGFGTVSGGGLCGMGALPTPSIIPEPVTIVLIAPAFLAFWNKNKRITRTK
jgi:hypothetical protein